MAFIKYSSEVKNAVIAAMNRYYILQGWGFDAAYRQVRMELQRDGKQIPSTHTVWKWIKPYMFRNLAGSCKKTDKSDGSDKSDKLNFTPGPWHILVPKPRYGNRECHSIVDGGGEYVAKIVAVSVLRGISAVTREERKANEHLIAAAPDMYDALKSECVTCQLRDHETNCEECKIGKALKKAMGEE